MSKLRFGGFLLNLSFSNIKQLRNGGLRCGDVRIKSTFRRIESNLNHFDGCCESSYVSTELPVVISTSNSVKVTNNEVENAEEGEEDEQLDSLALKEVKLEDIPTIVSKSFNLAAYVNQSETLQELMKLGVDLSNWDRQQAAAEFILKLDFERDIKPTLCFLHDLGMSADRFGHYLTKNPFVLGENIEDLHIRINYMKSKKFDPSAIARIVTEAPSFLLLTTKRIDSRLGFFQKEFLLTGNEVRHVVTRLPKLITWNLSKLRENQFALKEEFGFEPNELKQLLKEKPKLWLIGRKSLHERFDLIHNQMGISHELILNFPGGLTRRVFSVKQRHLFLVALRRAQYDPQKENYVSLKAIVSGSDAEFCLNVAKASVEKFNDFLKTL